MPPSHRGHSPAGQAPEGHGGCPQQSGTAGKVNKQLAAALVVSTTIQLPEDENTTFYTKCVKKNN